MSERRARDVICLSLDTDTLHQTGPVTDSAEQSSLLPATSVGTRTRQDLTGSYSIVSEGCPSPMHFSLRKCIAHHC